MRQSGSESSFLKFLRITGDMLFGPIALFTLRDLLLSQFPLGSLDASTRIFHLDFLDNRDKHGLFGRFSMLIYQLLM